MSSLSRSVSRSTELLHVTRQESTGARRSWDSLVPDKKSSGSGSRDDARGTPSQSDATGGGVRSPPPASSSYQSPSVASGNVPWFGGGPTTDSKVGTLTRCALLTQSDHRPVTYEEELEDRLGQLRISASVLSQRLVTERKKGKDMTHQMIIREQTYRNIIERIRGQYDQRFERLKNRACLLVTRCEQLRSEKLQAEGRTIRMMEQTAKERLAMEKKISILQDELERLKAEKESSARTTIEQDLLLELRITEDFENPASGPPTTTTTMTTSRSNGLAKDHYRMLCEVAIARISQLESCTDVLRNMRSVKVNEEDGPPSLSRRRSSSCPELSTAAAASISQHLDVIDTGYDPPPPPTEEPLPVPSPPCSNARAAAPTAEVDATTFDRLIIDEGMRILRVKDTERRLFAGDVRRSMPPPSPPSSNHKHSRPSSIKSSLQKLFTGGGGSAKGMNWSDPAHISFSTNPSAAAGSISAKRHSSVTARKDIFSDDEDLQSPTHAADQKGGKGKYPPPTKKTRSPSSHVTGKGHHLSLSRAELLRKFQNVSSSSSRHEKEFLAEAARGGAALTKQERVLGIRIIDREAIRDLGGGGGGDPPGDDSVPPPFQTVPPLQATDNNSTESLPEKIDGQKDNKSASASASPASAPAVRRNHSVHSTFGRLHHRRNGITDIDGKESRTLLLKTQSTAALPLGGVGSPSHFGKNLRHYLH